MLAGFEPYYGKAAAFLLRLSEKCLGIAIKRWREDSKDREKRDAASLIHEVELTKSVEQKINERITISLHGLSLSEDKFELLLSTETDPLLKEKLAELLFSGRFSASGVVKLWIDREPRLESEASSLISLAEIFVDAIDKSIAASSEGARLLAIRVDREIVRQNDVTHERLNEILYAVQAFKTVGSLSTRSDSDDSAKTVLATLYEKRFQRGKADLEKRLPQQAERAFRELILDIEADKTFADKVLLFRSYSNLAASEWEQGRMRDAVEHYKTAIELLPDDWRSQRHRALIALAEGQKEVALSAILKLAEERPDEGEHLCNAALIAKTLDDSPRALAILKRKRFEEPEYLGTLALVYNDLKEYDKAAAEARFALTLDEESVTALCALSAALTLPINRLRTEHGTLHVTPTQSEMSALREAAETSEKAASLSRKGNRRFALYDSLVNLPPIYLMLGRVREAVEVSKELSVLSPDDASILINLWCAEMRAEDYEGAAKTGAKLFELEKTGEAWERKVQPLLGLGNADEVVSQWNTDSNAFDSVRDSPDAQSIAAEALFRNHETERALSLLQTSRFAQSATLLTSYAKIKDELGEFGEAEACYKRAEANALPSEKAHATIALAYFYFHKHRWAEAADHFARLGAENTQGMMFHPYLICLFNSGQLKTCLFLCEKSFQEDSEPIDEAYTLAARCYYASGDLLKARDLLSTVVGKGGPREYEHRRMLTHIYWQLDEAEKAYDAAKRTLAAKKDDLECLIFLSVICTRIKKHTEGCQYAVNAVKLAAQSPRAHAALVRSVVSSGKDANLSNDAQEGYFSSVKFLENSGTGFLQTIPIESDFRTLKELVRARARGVDEIEKLFRKKLLPIGLFAKEVGHNEFDVWRTLLDRARPPVRFQTGQAKDQEEQQFLSDSESVIATDIFSLFTLGLLGRLNILPRLYKTVYVHGTTLEAIVQAFRTVDENPTQGSFAFVDGKFQLRERTKAEAEGVKTFLASLKEFIKGPSVTLAGVITDGPLGQEAEQLRKALGDSSLFTMLLSHQRGCVMLSDDAALRLFHGHLYSGRGICTQAVLRSARKRQIITEDEYQDSLLKLISHNYCFVSDELERLYRTTRGVVSPLATELLSRASDAKCDVRGLLPILARFAIFIWREREGPSGSGKDSWLMPIWEGMAKASEAVDLHIEMNTLISSYCLTDPGTYFGLCDWTERNVPVAKEHVEVFRVLKIAHGRAAIRVLSEHFGWLSETIEAWKAQLRMETLLRRRF
jgi:tetratricopeptide (TPR) repeat protein